MTDTCENCGASEASFDGYIGKWTYRCLQWNLDTRGGDHDCAEWCTPQEWAEKVKPRNQKPITDEWIREASRR